MRPPEGRPAEAVQVLPLSVEANAPKPLGFHTTRLASAAAAMVPPPLVASPCGSLLPWNQLLPPSNVKAELLTGGLAVGLPLPTRARKLGVSSAKSMPV